MTADARQLEQLSAYLDGELTAEESAQVERLLAQDEGARHLLAQLRHTSQFVSTLPRASAPANLSQQIRARLERSALLDKSLAPQAARSRVGTRTFALAASLLLAITATWVAWSTLVSPSGPHASLQTASRQSSQRNLSHDMMRERPEAGHNLPTPTPPPGEQLAFAKKARNAPAQKDAESNPLALTEVQKEIAPAAGAADTATTTEMIASAGAAPQNDESEHAAMQASDAVAPAMALKPESPTTPKELPSRIDVEIDAANVAHLVNRIKTNLDEQSFSPISARGAGEASSPGEMSYAIIESPPKAEEQTARRNPSAETKLDHDEVNNFASSKKSSVNADDAVRIVVNLPRNSSEKYLASLNTLVLANGATIKNKVKSGTLITPSTPIAMNDDRKESAAEANAPKSLPAAKQAPATRALGLSTTQPAPSQTKRKMVSLGESASSVENKRDAQDDGFHTITILIHPKIALPDSTTTQPAHLQTAPSTRPAQGASRG